MSRLLESRLTPEQRAQAAEGDAQQAAALAIFEAQFGHIGPVPSGRAALLRRIAEARALLRKAEACLSGGGAASDAAAELHMQAAAAALGA